MATTISIPDEGIVAIPQKKNPQRCAPSHRVILITAEIALIVKFLMAWNTVTTSNVLRGYKSVYTNVINKMWAPRSLLSWLLLIAELIMLWRKAKRADPVPALFSVCALSMRNKTGMTA